MAEEKEQFQSIYGDAVSEFEAEDVSDETLSISKEAIEKGLEKEQEVAAETADEAKETAAEVPVRKEQPATEETPNEEPAAEPEQTDEIPEDEDITYEDHTADRDPQEISADQDATDDEPEDDKVGIASYILHAILFTIPVIGTILMLVYIIDDRKNAHLRHLAQIWLVTLIIIAIGAHIALRMLGIA